MDVKRMFCLLFALSLLALACSEDDDEGGADAGSEAEALTASEVEGVWGEVEGALTSSQEDLIADLSRAEIIEKDEGEVEPRALAVEVDRTVENPSGAGTAHIYGDGARSDAGWALDLTIEFTGWEVPSVETIDHFSGALSLAYEVTQLVPPAMTISVEGELSVTKGRLTLPGQVSAEVVVEGQEVSVCGELVGQPIGDGPCP